MTNDQVSQILSEIADLLEMSGAERFRINAFQRASRAVAHLPKDIREYADAGALREIPGVGPSIAAKIQEFLDTGSIRLHQELCQGLPDGVLHLLHIPGIGPKTAVLLCRELNVSTVDALERALEAGRLEGLPRIGAKTAEKIRRGIRNVHVLTGRTLLGSAMPVAEALCASMRPIVADIVPVGSLRRLEETVGDVTLLAASDDPGRTLQAFTALPMVATSGPVVEHQASVLVRSGLSVTLRVVRPEHFGNTLLWLTGSRAHVALLQARAQSLGLELRPDGISEARSGRVDSYRQEEHVYDRLGLPWIPPELRWGEDEIDLAANGLLPELVDVAAIKGDLHCHTDWSDGKNPIEVMVDAAQQMGYRYIAITDHSAGRGIANGLRAERLVEQAAIIQRLNAQSQGPLRVLAGSEVDIRSDGSLDFPDEVLAALDVVVASIHSSMGQDRATMTARLVRAMESPHVDIIGHPSTRLIGERPPIDVDIAEVFRAAARTGTAMEINASPSRLDLKDDLVRQARRMGVKLVVSSDSHAATQLPGLRYGAWVARRGMCGPGDILNTLPLDQFLRSLKGGSSERR